jgi:hypothetical protein
MGKDVRFPLTKWGLDFFISLKTTMKLIIAIIQPYRLAKEDPN